MPPSDLETIFHTARALPEDQRTAYLQAACADDPALRRQVEDLLEAEAAAEGFLADRSPGHDDHDLRPGQTIDRYRLLEVLGEGGFGTVWMAEQFEPVHRRVALKVIKLGMDTREVILRFETERQALALMDHPNIARILDGGATPGGRPYFVMDLVSGQPITDYSDRVRLRPRERLELFEQICRAVQHAHQKGVIHRDLKPSNVLVVEQDGRPVPKIIDFGIAKATSAELMQRTLFTDTRRVLGTPDYMAPEQAARSDQDIDTRADVYSLGVLLYELLTGTRPFRSREIGFDAMLAAIRDQDPPRPSTRVSTSSGEVGEIAARRRSNPRALQRSIRGDLDWIVMRSLEKERERRYPGASDLADDVRRHLDGRPVEAGPPSRAYRLRRYVGRNRGKLLAAGLSFASLLAGLIAFALENRRAQANLRNFNHLALTVELDRLTAAADDLYPAWPENAPRMRSWLFERVQPLMDELQGLHQSLDAIAARARPISEEQLEADRGNHPQAQELAALQQQLAALERAQAVSRGEVEYEPFPLDVARFAAFESLPSFQRMRAIFNAGAPFVDTNRPSFGREAEGLAILRYALAGVPPGETPRNVFLKGLIAACFANGLDDEALQLGADTLQGAGADDADFQFFHQTIVWAIQNDARGNQINQLRPRVEELAARVNRRRTWEFDDDADQFLFSALQEIVDRIDDLYERLYDVEMERLAWAEAIEEATIDRYRDRWEEARAALAKADGVVASDLYARVRIDLQPQMGLVPLGMNPSTGLWEFYHPRSSNDCRIEDGRIHFALPDIAADGSIEMAWRGLVFVLIPGGPAFVGAQREEPDGRHFDPIADADETPILETTIEPFFLSRYEMTIGQWKKLSRGESPAWHKFGLTYRGMPEPVNDHNPVESVDWHESTELMRRFGLMLPTESHWEYACRAGTSTPWAYTGSRIASLEGHANVVDATHALHYETGNVPAPFDDHWAATAPVGTFAANPFGLHDMHGNVWEWCSNRYDGQMRSPIASLDHRVLRGGSYGLSANYARCSQRFHLAAEHVANDCGLRPARRLH